MTMFFGRLIASSLLLFSCWPPAFSEIRKGSASDYSHIFRGTKPLKELYKGNKKLWENTNPPVIPTFTSSPSNIDLDTRATGTVSFTMSVTGRSGQTTSAHIVKLPEGSRVGPEYTSSSGGNISQTLPNIPQPTQTTTYRLIAMNTGGSSHEDTTITVTQNPVITNLRRTGFIDPHDGSSGGNYKFEFQLKGTPQPVITWTFGNGQTSQRNNDDIFLTPVSGQVNTWNVLFGGTAGIRISTNTTSLTVTATNSSGSTTATIANIGN